MMMLGGGALGKGLRKESKDITKDISTHLKESQQSSLTPSTM